MIFGGIGADMAPRAMGARLGPEGATYVVSIAETGAIFLKDVGAIGGPGAWAVQINGSNNYWYYNGEGQVDITVDANGQVTLNGGVGPVTVGILESMLDMNTLLPLMFTMVGQSPSLQAAWNSNAMQTLYSMGFPNDCMLNMNMDCCQQFMDFLDSVTFPSGFQLQPEDLETVERLRQFDPAALAEAAPHLQGWWGCTVCQVLVAAGTAALIIGVIIVFAASAPVSGAVSAIAATEAAAVLATATTLTATQIANIAVTAFLAGGAVKLLDRVIEGICILMGYCSSTEDCVGC